MKVRNAIKKIEKHFAKQGVDVKIHSPEKGGGYKWWFQHGERVASFCANGYNGWEPDALDGDVSLIHIRRENDISDPYTDYHAGYFLDNISQLCESVLPSPPKFPAGVLIRGKGNKRATRGGYAGRVGLVMKTGSSYVHVRWHGETDADIQKRYNLSYPVRDLELVSG